MGVDYNRLGGLRRSARAGDASRWGDRIKNIRPAKSGIVASAPGSGAFDEPGPGLWGCDLVQKAGAQALFGAEGLARAEQRARRQGIEKTSSA
jgi:hypothetical protein